MSKSNFLNHLYAPLMDSKHALLEKWSRIPTISPAFNEAIFPAGISGSSFSLSDTDVLVRSIERLSPTWLTLAKQTL